MAAGWKRWTVAGLLAVCATGSVRADWNYEYFQGSWSTLPNFAALQVLESGTVANITLAPRNRDDQFGFRFTNTLTVPSSGTYTFSTASDDGSRLYIDGQLVVDNDGLHARRQVNGSVSLTPGNHSIEVTFFEQGGAAVLEVFYAPPGGGLRGIPSNGALEGPPNPAVVGSWGAPISWPEIAISAATLPDGRVLTWSSTETNSFPSNREFTHASVFDPATETFVSVDNGFHDMFCAGVSHLEDGTVVAAGGNPWDTRTTAFDPDTLSWTALDNMNFNRWYGSTLTLPTNEIFATFARQAGDESERYNAASNTWVHTPGATMEDLLNEQNAANSESTVNSASNMQWWAELAVMPDGRVFHGGPTQTLHVFDASGFGSVESLGQPLGDRTRMWGNTVSYDVGRALMLGGSDRTVNPATINAAYKVDLGGAAPTITATNPMNFARTLSNSVVLPTGEVLVMGGNTTGQLFNDNGSVLAAEIWNPVDESWRIVGSMTVPRNYHSVAVLLKDGRVLSAGGGACGNGCAANHQDGEIFTPPYLFNADGSAATRPDVVAAPASTRAGDTFAVQATGNVARFAMIRLSGVSHATNTDQRYVPVDFSVSGGGWFELRTIDNGNALIPGSYWLYAIDAAGVPSVGRTVRVVSGAVDNDDVSYRYYEGTWTALPAFANLTPVTEGRADDFNLGVRERNSNFAVQFDATLTFPSTGNYEFFLSSDDGSRLYIDDELILDNDGVHGAIEVSTNVSGTTGTRRIRVEYFQATGPRELTVSWSGPGFAKQEIAASALGAPAVVADLGIFTSSSDVGAPSLPGSAGVTNSVYTVTGAGEGFGGSSDELHLLSKTHTGDGEISAEVLGVSAPTANALGGVAFRDSLQPGARMVAVVQQPDGRVAMRWRNNSNGAAQSTALTGSAGSNKFLRLRRTGNTFVGEYSTVSGTGPWQQIGSVTVTMSGDIRAGLLTTAESAGSAATAVFAGVVHEQILVDTDGDGVPDVDDVFPNDPTEWADTDGDGVGDNGDAFPDDPTESADSDADGVGDNADLYPNDPDNGAFEARHSTTLVLEDTGTTQRVWNVNPDNDTVSVLTQDGVLLAEIAVGDEPWALAVAPLANEVWVANKAEATLSVIDTTTFAVNRTVALDTGSQPHGLVFGNDSSDLYVVLEAVGTLLKIDATTDAVLATADLGNRPRHLGISADGATLYVSRFITPLVPGETGAEPDLLAAAAEVVEVAAANLAVTDTLTLGHSTRPREEGQGPGLPNYLNAPIIARDGATLYVPSKQDNIDGGSLRSSALTFDQAVRAVTSVVDLNTGNEQLIERVDHDNSSLATGAALSPLGDYLFVALETSREVAVIDTSGPAELLRIPVGRAPQSVAVSARGTRLYVHNFMDRSISVFDVTALIANGTPIANELSVVNLVANEALSASVLNGKQLFNDAADNRLSTDNYMSCASCHNNGDSDGRVWDFTQFGEGVRNTIALTGQGGMANGALHWSANFDELQDFEGQIREFAGGTGLMSNAQFNAGTRSDPLGDPKAGVSTDLDDLAAYLSSLSSVGPSPNKSGGALTSAGSAGRVLFGGVACGTCHSGTGFTDSVLGTRHDIGTLSSASGDRLGGTLDGLDTPTLRGLWLSAPYLHDGSAATIEAAIAAHNTHSLSAAERGELAAYLRQLDDAEQPPVTNSPPVLTNPGDQSTQVDVPVNLSLSATDADGDSVSFGATNLPTGLSVVGSSVQGTPSVVGSFGVTLTAVDAFGNTDSVNIDWLVSAAQNTAPTLAAPGAQTGTVGAPASLQLVGADADNDTLSYSASGLPPALAVNPITGLISGTLTASGTYSVTASVSDGVASASRSFDWFVSPGGQSQTVSVRIDAGGDDVEERGSSGSLSATSSDLELAFDGSRAQWIGLRFPQLAVPNGATIESATVQFQVDETNSGATDLTIYAVNTGDAAPFVGAFSVSSRPRTLGVDWAPGPWSTVGEAGAQQRTPNLAAAVQAVVNRPDWVAGNALAVVITGSGERTAESHNGSASGAPLLQVTFNTEGSGNVAPTVDDPGPQSNGLGTAVSLFISASDIDGDALSFTASGLPQALAIDPLSGEISGNVTEVGVFPVTVTVSDGQTSAATSFTWTVTSTSAVSFTRAVDNDADDAEEGAAGDMSLSSSDLELVSDGSDVQLVGMRFRSVVVPAGATITTAYIQFQVDEVSTDFADLSIFTEAVANAATYSATDFDISSRSLSSNSVFWQPPAWPDRGARGVAQRTPSLVSIVQEVIDNPGWASGNAMGFVISGSGEHTVEAFDGDASGAPTLYLEYNLAGGSSVTVERVIDNSAADAEERLSDRVLRLASSDLELGTDNGSAQWVGLLFDGLRLPPGVTIVSAHLQLHTDEVSSGPATAVIHGEASAAPIAFDAANTDLATRTRTSAAVSWDVADWLTIGEGGPAQRSPNLAPVIQELVDRGDWQLDSTVVLLIDGTGERTAESFNGDPSRAPVLTIEYLR